MKYFIVDAFSDRVFKGNQAGVCLPDRPLDDVTMQNIAAENNLAETAFVMQKKGNDFDLRWFTPEVEIDLCGHATLASAFVLSNFADTSLDVMRFHTLSGVLTVTKQDDLYEMDFPARMPRLSKQARREWSLYIGVNGRRQYNGLCRRCQRDCKQSIRAKVLACPKYLTKRSKRT